MHVAILNEEGLILRFEDIVVEGYIPDEPWAERADDWAVGGRLVDGVYAPPPAPSELPSQVPVLSLYAGARLTIAAADITGVGVNSRFAGAFWFDVGQYWVFFAESLPDSDYLALCYDDAGAVRAFVREADKSTDYFVITVTDQAGAPADAEFLSLEIKRVM